MNLYSRFADFVVLLHAGYVAFVVVGLLAVLVGWLARWTWTRNLWFRVVHLAMIAIVVTEALLGITCPLTTWEHQLRVKAGESPQDGAFVARIVHDLIFIDAPPWAFTAVYCAFGALVLAAWLVAPPRWSHSISGNCIGWFSSKL